MTSANVQSKRLPQRDPRLDWAPQHDPRSLQFRVSAALPTVEPAIVPKEWTLGAVLDQGREGACVGFGHTADMLASPKGNYVATPAQGSSYAQGVYQRAKQIDEWPGEAYSGTSVLAGAKVMQERGIITSYYWAFSNAEIRNAILTLGPVVIGVPWYEEMYDTKPNGVVKIGGELVGGHCLMIYGYHPHMRIYGEAPSGNPKGPNYHEVFRWRNSWGHLYGRNGNGNGIIHAADLRRLLDEWGEACVATGRVRATLT